MTPRTDSERMDWLEKRARENESVMLGWERADSDYDEFHGKTYRWPETFFAGNEDQAGQPFSTLRAAVDAAMDAELAAPPRLGEEG